MIEILGVISKLWFLQEAVIEVLLVMHKANVTMAVSLEFKDISDVLDFAAAPQGVSQISFWRACCLHFKGSTSIWAFI